MKRISSWDTDPDRVWEEISLSLSFTSLSLLYSAYLMYVVRIFDLP